MGALSYQYDNFDRNNRGSDVPMTPEQAAGWDATKAWKEEAVCFPVCIEGKLFMPKRIGAISSTNAHVRDLRGTQLRGTAIFGSYAFEFFLLINEGDQAWRPDYEKGQQQGLPVPTAQQLEAAGFQPLP